MIIPALPVWFSILLSVTAATQAWWNQDLEGSRVCRNWVKGTNQRCCRCWCCIAEVALVCWSPENNTISNWLLFLKLGLLISATLQTLIFCYSLSYLVPFQKEFSCPYLHHPREPRPSLRVTNRFLKGLLSTEFLLPSPYTLPLLMLFLSIMASYFL